MELRLPCMRTLPPYTLPKAPLPQQPPLPEKVKQKILRGEYIDFDTLLPESLYPARHGLSPSPSFTLRLLSDTTSTDRIPSLSCLPFLSLYASFLNSQDF